MASATDRRLEKLVEGTRSMLGAPYVSNRYFLPVYHKKVLKF